MALVHQPIDLKAILADVTSQASEVKRKTTTLIDYYIYPEKTPSAISAYEPRIGILESRTKALSKISFPHLSRILDHADATGASYLNEIIDQLLNAVHGVAETFEHHYDRGLEQRKPYLAIYKLLEYREKQLKEFIMSDMMNPNALRPEHVRPSEAVYFCRGAIQMINDRDNGRIETVRDRDLLDSNRSVMSRFGGGYIWWQCTSCAYRVRFHMINSLLSSIHTVEELREHSNLPIEYRSAFLAKSHLFTVSSDEERVRRRRSSFTALTEAVKYGCIFCYAEGKALNRDKTAFESARSLAHHLVEKHKSSLPPSLMLQKFAVAVKGKCAEHVRRWDVNFT